MKYRRLGNTGLEVSEIGLGGEWLERHDADEVRAVIDRCASYGINILDCWMSEPNVRSNIGRAIHAEREKWIVQGHIGSTWQNGQYVRTRDMRYVRPAFEDLLRRMDTDYIDLGMIHFVDNDADYEAVTNGPFFDYVMENRQKGVVRHIGMSTHNPRIALRAAESGFIEMLLFSLNPAYDIMPANDDYGFMFEGELESDNNGIDPERAALYRLCETRGIGMTVMKGFAGGRLLDAARSPLGAALTPVQLIHYALTRPGVASILVGIDTPEQADEAVRYETADDAEKDYATVLASAPKHAYSGLCTYCGHCKPCPKNIDIAMVNKYYDLASAQPAVPESVRQHYLSLEHRAGECVKCRACEARCPFGVNISERMEKAAKLFGF